MNLNAAIAASPDAPIVMIAVDFDPFARGYVASLARPGGRITGLSSQQIELTLKRLQLFKESFPEFASAIVFFDALSKDQWVAAEAAGAKTGLKLTGIDLKTPPFDYDGAIAQLPSTDCSHLIVLGSPRIFADRKSLAEFAIRRRLVSMFPDRDFADVGGAMSYGPNINAMFAQAADIVHRIARGAKPSDLPIEQPTKFEFVINLATARALGFEFSAALLARADEVIE